MSPVPLQATVISPFDPSVIVIDPEFVPAFVSSTKSCVPEDVRFPEADPLPTTTSPLPFVFNDMFPYQLSTLTFDATEEDINYFTATVSFKYTIFNITDLSGNNL